MFFEIVFKLICEQILCVIYNIKKVCLLTLLRDRLTFEKP